MSKNRKGMVCVTNPWEYEDWRANGILPDCRNHRHLSRRRAFELFGGRLAGQNLAHVYDAQQQFLGYIGEFAGQVRWCEKSRVPASTALAFDASYTETIKSHLNRFQAMIDAGQASFEVIK